MKTQRREAQQRSVIYSQTTIGKVWTSSSKLWNSLEGKETRGHFANAEEVVVSN